MYETIYIEKNKSTRFGIHLYEDSSQWQLFCENCQITGKKSAAIYNTSLPEDAWYSLAKSFDISLKLDEKDNDAAHKMRMFLDKNKECTFIIFSNPFIMEMLQNIINADDHKLSYVLIPVTPFALLDSVSVKPKTDAAGEIICKELFPQGIYVDTSIILNASAKDFLGGIASAFRLAISHKASMFEWMIYYLYELLDCEEDTVKELLCRGYNVYKERIEKDTAKERSLPFYGINFYKIIKESELVATEADLWALAMVCQSYLSWKSNLLSMEEYYEIRDMFVAFGLSITETEVTDETFMIRMADSKYNILKDKETVLIRKLGKVLLYEVPAKELVQEAFAQIYFNEEANE